MANEENEVPPDAVVEDFIFAMNQWETQANKLRRSAKETSDPSSYQLEVRATMSSLFEKYCTPKDRPYGRLGSFRHPPEYDPATELVTDCAIDGRTAKVTTYRNAVFGDVRIYTLKKLDGVWLIDNVKRLEDGKPVRTTL